MRACCESSGRWIYALLFVASSCFLTTGVASFGTLSLFPSRSLLYKRQQQESQILPSSSSRPRLFALEVDKTNPAQEERQRIATLPFTEGRTLTKHEKEFQDMIVEFMQFSDADIAGIAHPRDRVLYEGVAASGTIPEVYRAFEVLFEDWSMIRLIGRWKFNRLRSHMKDSKILRQQEIDKVTKETALKPEEIQQSRVAFLKMADIPKKEFGEPILQMQTLLDTGIADGLVEFMGYSSLQDLQKKLTRNGKHNSWGFVEFMLSLQQCTSDDELCNAECNLAVVLHQLVEDLEQIPTEPPLDKERQKHLDRYNFMVDSFKSWKAMASPSGKGRNQEVIRGCFRGAEDPRIVEALKIVYVDYRGLRLAGNLIFGIAEEYVKRRRKNKA